MTAKRAEPKPPPRVRRLPDPRFLLLRMWLR
ncbi:hypothetical protein KIPE111705_46840 [Kibdelosporangium persicum]